MYGTALFSVRKNHLGAGSCFMVANRRYKRRSERVPPGGAKMSMGINFLGSVEAFCRIVDVVRDEMCSVRG